MENYVSFLNTKFSYKKISFENDILALSQQKEEGYIFEMGLWLLRGPTFGGGLFRKNKKHKHFALNKENYMKL